MPLDAEAVIARLGLRPHPEGGWYRETWRAATDAASDRAAGTAIYFLLGPGERSHWHRVDAAEIWHHYAGGPLRLEISVDGVTSSAQVLGADLAEGELPQLVVPPHAWQAAEPAADEAVLVGCTVSPGFEFAHFDLAPPCWEPGVNS